MYIWTQAQVTMDYETGAPIQFIQQLVTSIITGTSRGGDLLKQRRPKSQPVSTQCSSQATDMSPI